jgi:hypothetical protein
MLQRNLNYNRPIVPAILVANGGLYINGEDPTEA